MDTILKQNKTQTLVVYQNNNKRKINYDGRNYNLEKPELPNNKKTKLYLKVKSQKTLTGKKIKKREYKTVKDEQDITTKLLRELTKTNKFSQKECCDSFGKEFSDGKVKLGINWASVRGTFLNPNKDRASSGKLEFGNSFHTGSAPYWILCDGNGTEGVHASKFFTEKFPLKLTECLKGYNFKEWSTKGIWNALKIACTLTDEMYPEGIIGGASMIFCCQLDGYLYFASVGDCSAFIFDEDEILRMSRPADLMNPDFSDGVEKRGGTITFDKNEMLPRIEDMINVGRGFGNKIEALQNEWGKKVFSARCKITRKKIDELHDNHTIILCSKGVTNVTGNTQPLLELIKKLRTELDLSQNFTPLCEKILQAVLATKEVPQRDDATIQIFKV